VALLLLLISDII